MREDKRVYRADSRKPDAGRIHPEHTAYPVPSGLPECNGGNKGDKSLSCSRRGRAPQRRRMSGVSGLILACIMVCVLCAGALTGCHGARNRTAFAVPSQLDEERKFEITFWAKNDTNLTQTKIYEKAIRDFQTLYPNITVNMRLYTDYGKIYNDVITNIATDTTPNVCVTYPDHIATYLTGSDIVVPLDALFSDPHYGLGGSELRYEGPGQEEIVPAFLKECVLGENHYAIPYMRSTEACYINKTFVEKLGYELPEALTWDFVWEVSEAAMKKNADGTFALNGQKVLIPFIYKSTDNMMIQMLKQRGGGYSTDAGTVEIFNDTTKEILGEIAEHGKTGAFSTFKISGYPGNFLNAGQCIFAIDSTAGATWMGSDAPLTDIGKDRIVQFETAVRTVPQSDPEHPQMISQGPSICLFNKEDPQEVLAAWLFTQYLLTDEVQNAYAQTEGYVPVTTRAQQSEAYQDYLARAGEDNNDHYEVKIRASEVLLNNTENTFVTPVFNGSTSLRDAAGQMIENTVKSVRRKEKVDDAYFKKLFSDVTSLYRLDRLMTGSGADGENVSAEGGGSAGGAPALGPLPTASKALLGALVVSWAGLLAWWLYRRSHAK